MKIFLTGATGYLGERLVSALLEDGHEIRALIRNPEAMNPDISDRLEIVQGDLAVPADPAFFEGIDALIHTAAMVKNWSPNRWLFSRINAEGYRHLLQAAKEAGVPKILHTSSFMALGPSTRNKGPMHEQSPRWGGPFMNDYERTKCEAEMISRRFVEEGGPLVTLYPAVIYGPGRRTDGNLIGKLAFLIKEGKFPGLLGSGTQRWTLSYVEDIVSGHLKALEKGVPGSRFILGGPEVTLKDLVLRLSRLLGRSERAKTLPIALGKCVGALQILRARLGGAEPELTPGVAEVYRHDWTYSSQNAVERLDYRITPLDEGLTHTADWVRGLTSWQE
ncbi:MAG: NAD-dependent epimerase/dehydratase family protein [Candidatus Eisenbacteria bacterium]|uniref:NAD-dependent epimerase/dehydratase family protein n=1 Tax=Eiseniibacteriota bacterium TaxID=2212470 RepID=A0A948W700_UNCEI|nr:NAD-dependent epimerase/dehydratase family protein [Candidatus Eisenbacteria bacterium]MBU1947519.1 NAD-dependent epimerase/dehydratase family protein [Candidatus Eisenbacteria bacterium]MBU2691675.1 NAD-dependent epimerase/dehydratase family protein [Candidatus Eisenbacteria bacterium]